MRLSKAVAKPVRIATDLVYRARYDFAAAVEDQDRRFAAWGLSRSAGLRAAERVWSENPRLDSPMRSEHHVLFGAISAKFEVKRILEIGTFDGRGAAVLASLFPASQIETIDLPDCDPAFKNSYKRSSEGVRQAFIEHRNELLGRFDNIRSIQMNSVALTTEARASYDLIWIDGDHGYPVVAIDIMNAIRLLNPSGIALCDDVQIASTIGNGGNSMYGSLGAHQTLLALQAGGVIDYGLVYKRLEPKRNAHPTRRKFIGLFRHSPSRYAGAPA